MREDPAFFRVHLLVDVDGEPTPFDSVIDDWQREDFEAVDGALRQLVVGEDEELPAKRRVYLERPRGHSKTTDIATIALWAMAFAPRKLTSIAAAADKDQAKLILKAIDRLLHLNEWLTELVSLHTHSLRSIDSGSVLNVISCDAMSSYGELPDFIVCDEFTHWPRQELWHSLLSSAAKRRRCVLVVISNAGITGSWQWDVLKKIQIDEAWYFRSLPEPMASWLRPEDHEEQRRLLPPLVYARLWLNQWTAGSGTAIPADEIDLALRNGEAAQIGPQVGPANGWSYAAGFDLGLAKDNAAFCLVARARVGNAREGFSDRFRLAHLTTWTPTKKKRVDIEEVMRTVVSLYRLFRFRCGFADPWQAEYLITQLHKAGVPMTRYNFNVATLDRLARNTLTQFTNGTIELYEHTQLLDEIRATNILEKTTGTIRFEWPRSATGHGDRAVAFNLALLAAKDAPQSSFAFKAPRGIPFKRSVSRGRRRNRLEALGSNRD